MLFTGCGILQLEPPGSIWAPFHAAKRRLQLGVAKLIHSSRIRKLRTDQHLPRQVHPGAFQLIITRLYVCGDREPQQHRGTQHQRYVERWGTEYHSSRLSGQ